MIARAGPRGDERDGAREEHGDHEEHDDGESPATARLGNADGEGHRRGRWRQGCPG
jgi:hypothetical protein